MKSAKRMGILCVVFLITSCAPMHPGIDDTQVLPERIFRTGFSFKPPDEKGWFIPRPGLFPPDVLLVRSQGDGPDETRMIRGSLSRVPEELAPRIAVLSGMTEYGYNTSDQISKLLAEIVKEATLTKNPRYKAVKLEVVPHPEKGRNCVKSDLTYEDSAPVRASGKADSMHVAALAFTCIHPHAKGVLIFAEYSHRYNPGQPDPQFPEKAASVLSSIEFATR